MKPKKGLLLLASDDSKDSHDMPDLGEYGDDEDKKDGGKDEAEEGDDNEQLALDCLKDFRKALLVDKDDKAALEHLKELLGYLDKD